MQRVDSDEVRIKKDFASLNIEECTKSSLLSTVMSIWKTSPENVLEEIFQFAHTLNNKVFAIYANGTIYQITEEGKMNTTVIGNSILSIEYHPKTSSLAVLTSKEVTYYDYNLNFIQSIPNTNKGIKLIKNSENLYILSKASIVSVKESSKVIPIEPWNLAFGSENYIALIGRNSFLMNLDESIIKINHKFNNPINAALSHDGSYLYVLESNSQLLIFKDYSLHNAIQMISTSQVCGWNGEIFVSMSPVGTVSYIDFNGRQIKSKNIAKGSVIFPIKNGFVTIKPTDVTNEKTHFDLIKFSAVTPYEIYVRNCERGYFTDALALIKQFNFDADIYHKAFVERFEPSKRLINEHLREIKDKDFVYNYIIQKNPGSAEIMGLLIREGLLIRPKDERLLRMQDRLHIFVKISKGSFPERQWESFKECSLAFEMMNWISAYRFEDVATVLMLTTELSEQERDNIMNAVSPFTEPEEYQALMPNNSTYFENRAKEIDRRTGDTGLIVRLLEIGLKRDSSLKKIYDDARELDSFVVSTSNSSAAAEMTLEKFSVLPDVEKLFLYIGNCLNGEEAAKMMKGPAAGICRRSQQAVIDLSARILTNDEAPMFGRMNPSVRIAEVSKMIQALPQKREIALEVLKKMNITLDVQTIQVLQDSWKPLVSESILRMMKFADYYIHCIGETTFSNIYHNISTDMICNVGKALIDMKNFSLDEWNAFADLAKKLKTEISKKEKFDASFRVVSFAAMVTLREWTEVEVETDSEINVLIEHIKKFIRSAKSCRTNDPNLVAAVTCLGMIPNGFERPETKSLYDKIRLYYAFDIFDVVVSPTIIDTAEDITALIITLLEQQSITNIKEMKKKISSLAKYATNIDLGKVNSFLALRALESNNVKFDIEILNLPDENVVLSYIDSPQLTDKQKIELCEPTLMKCSPENLSAFVDREFSLTGTPDLTSLDDDERDMEILRFVLQCTDNEITKMSIPMLKKPVEEAVMEFGKEIVSTDLGSYLKLIEHLHSIPVITENAYKAITEGYPKVVLSLDKAEDQYEALKSFVVTGVHIDLPDLYSRLFVKFQLKKDISINTAEEIAEKWSELGLPPSEALSLACGLHRIGCLSRSVSVKLAYAEDDKELAKRANSWSSILSANAEMEILKKTKNITFGLRSLHEEVAAEAWAMISKGAPLTDSVIDAIIDRGEASVFIELNKFDQLMSRVHSDVQLRKVFDSLRKAKEDEFLAKVLCDFYSIPDAFAQSPEEILRAIDKALPK